MPCKHTITHNAARHQQRGAALMVMLIIVVLGSVGFLVSSLNSSALQTARDKKTAEGLAQAKEALIGFAASVDLSGSKRPGDLPCPDLNNDGVMETSCGNSSGSTGQAARLGRLPWKTLGLPDLRDGSGERLWYAVSNNFKYNFRTTCTNSSLSGCLNSDTLGTISVFSSDGTLANDAGTGNSGVAAVIIAPNDVLTRQDSSTPQNRSSAGINNAINYLDISESGQDNADFADNSSTNGFIHGRIKNSSGQLIVNDQLITISQSDIILPIQKRVANEVKNCLMEYAALPQNQGPSPNLGYYPWAAARTISGGSIVYDDSDRLEFGHIPDIPFVATCEDTGGSNCDLVQSGGMKASWNSVSCMTNFNWGVNWKEMVFYGFGHSLRPHNLAHNHACGDTPTTCLVVNPPSTAADKPFVVIVAGKKIGSQVRATNTDKNTLSNYLEAPNNLGASPFSQGATTLTFNDVVVFP